jgi:hypothetical protein
VDAGVNACVTTDYDGNPHPIEPGFDSGAYERWIYVYLPLLMKNY